VLKVTTSRLVVGLVAVAVSVTLLLLPAGSGGPGVTWANYCIVRPGMTRAEVEDLLGGPPGGYSTEFVWLERDPSLPPAPYDGDLWWGDDGGIIVQFDSSQKVVAHGWLKCTYGTKYSFRRWVWRLEEWWQELRQPSTPPRAPRCLENDDDEASP
jgi:hypothetical protein